MNKALKSGLVFLGALIAIMATYALASIFNIDRRIFVVWIGMALFLNMYVQSRRPDATIDETKAFIVLMIMTTASICITIIMLI
jgi:hypothetical protein